MQKCVKAAMSSPNLPLNAKTLDWCCYDSKIKKKDAKRKFFIYMIGRHFVILVKAIKIEIEKHTRLIRKQILGGSDAEPTMTQSVQRIANVKPN